MEQPLPLVRPVLPMLATAGPVPTGVGWAYEMKWDGVRAIVEVTDGTVTIVSRNGREVAASYPELSGLADRLAGRHVIVDGEIVTLDPAGRPSFSRLQQRMHVRAPSARLQAAVPVRLYLFDILTLDGRVTVDQPYRQRRHHLEELHLDDELVQTPPAFVDLPGTDVLDAAHHNGLEGVVAKRLTSTYRPGQRSRDWIKTAIEHTTEVIIIGWKPGSGRRAGTIGSLLLGAHDEQGRLVYLGHVGTGFTQHALHLLQQQLAPLARDRSPLDQPAPRDHTRDAHWVDPVLVGEVAYRTVTVPDRRLRHPSWRGLRPDREPHEVHRPR